MASLSRPKLRQPRACHHYGFVEQAQNCASHAHAITMASLSRPKLRQPTRNAITMASLSRPNCASRAHAINMASLSRPKLRQPTPLRSAGERLQRVPPLNSHFSGQRFIDFFLGLFESIFSQQKHSLVTAASVVMSLPPITPICPMSC